MRIVGSNGTAPAASAPQARRAASGTFRLNADEPSRPASSATGLRTVGGIDALIALQGIEDPAERRRRAVGRGKNALDVLDELKISLLSGTLERATLGKLKSAAAGLKDATGDPALDGVLAEIELRVEVEIAKTRAA